MIRAYAMDDFSPNVFVDGFALKLFIKMIEEGEYCETIVRRQGWEKGPSGAHGDNRTMSGVDFRLDVGV
jgi:hypothetical protein